MGFGPQDTITIRDSADATSVAVNTDIFTVPISSGVMYRLVSCTHGQSVASTSGTVKYRVISDTTAPGAAASATNVELVGVAGTNTISTASTANTPVADPVIGGVQIKPGNRIARLSGGTQTNLVGYNATLVLAPVDYVL